MKIVLEQSVDSGAWDRLLAADAGASFYHHRVFLDSLIALYPRFGRLFFLALDDAGRLLGGLPAIRIRRTGLTQLLSLPFGSYGTPLSLSPGREEGDMVRTELTRRWLEEARRAGVVRAHLVPFHGHGESSAGIFPPGWRVPEKTHLIPLTGGFDDIWFRRYDKENRTASRKAERLGVVVREETGSPAAGVLDGLYRPQAREWTEHAPYHYGLFHRLAEAAPEEVRIWVARHEGAPVFATMTFYLRDTATPWVSGSAPEARRLCAGNLIHKVMIEDAVRRGFAVYNFGGSGGVKGIEEFKVAFGAVPFEYASWFHEAPWFGRLRTLRRRVLRRVRGRL